MPICFSVKPQFALGAGIEAVIGKYERLTDMVIRPELSIGARLCTSYFLGSEVIKRSEHFGVAPQYSENMLVPLLIG